MFKGKNILLALVGFMLLAQPAVSDTTKLDEIIRLSQTNIKKNNDTLLDARINSLSFEEKLDLFKQMHLRIAEMKAKIKVSEVALDKTNEPVLEVMKVAKTTAIVTTVATASILAFSETALALQQRAAAEISYTKAFDNQMRSMKSRLLSPYMDSAGELNRFKAYSTLATIGLVVALSTNTLIEHLPETAGDVDLLKNKKQLRKDLEGLEHTLDFLNLHLENLEAKFKFK